MEADMNEPVVAGVVPAIHVFNGSRSLEDAGARHKHAIQPAAGEV
jgi:hypothetical protein